jgi:8-oxo-dGTP diphosphatase
MSGDGPTVAVSAVILVDARGHLLLQLRDEQAPVAANQWGLVGGRVEPGESPEAGARRELWEETGLTVGDELAHFATERQPAASRPGFVDWHVYYAGTQARDEDVVLGEGAAIVFVDPDRLGDMDLARSAAYFLPRFLGSPGYRSVVGR